MAPKALLALTLLAVGCATPAWHQRSSDERKAVIQRLASQHLQCPESAIHVDEDVVHGFGSDECTAIPMGFTASGCGLSADYGLDEQRAPRLDFITAEEAVLRQWVQELLQTQHPGTSFTLDKLYWSPGHRQLEARFSWTESEPSWKLRFDIAGTECEVASAEALAEQMRPYSGANPSLDIVALRATACGGTFEVLVTYEGPSAVSMPAPRGFHLQQLAEALAAKQKAVHRPAM